MCQFPKQGGNFSLGMNSVTCTWDSVAMIQYCNNKTQDEKIKSL